MRTATRVENWTEMFPVEVRDRRSKLAKKSFLIEKIAASTTFTRKKTVTLTVLNRENSGVNAVEPGK